MLELHLTGLGIVCLVSCCISMFDRGASFAPTGIGDAEADIDDDEGGLASSGLSLSLLPLFIAAHSLW